jgi:hypothetical protein
MFWVTVPKVFQLQKLIRIRSTYVHMQSPFKVAPCEICARWLFCVCLCDQMRNCDIAIWHALQAAAQSPKAIKA